MLRLSLFSFWHDPNDTNETSKRTAFINNFIHRSIRGDYALELPCVLLLHILFMGLRKIRKLKKIYFMILIRGIMVL